MRALKHIITCIAVTVLAQANAYSHSASNVIDPDPPNYGKRDPIP